MTVVPALRRRLPVAAVLLALPVVMAPGRCGFLLDFTETLLITRPVERIDLDAHDGSMIATAYDRGSILLKRHTYGFEPSIGEVSHDDSDRVLELVAHCKYEGNCTFDHMFEMPLGVGFDITMMHSEISIGYVDADITATWDSGLFKGVRLAAPNTTLTLGEGDIDLDFAAAPASVVIDLREGAVTIEVPPGSYNCKLDAGGEVKTSDITCDAAAPAILDITVETGDITVKGVE